MVSPFLPDDQKVAAVREALPATAAGIYLDTATRGPLPAETARAMAEVQDWELRVGRVGADADEELQVRLLEARAALAAVLRASPDEIALTHGLAGAMSAGAWAVAWRPGDGAVTTPLGPEAGAGALWSLRERLGVVVTVARAGDGADPEGILAAVEAAIRPGTRLVAVPHVDAATGAVLPVRRLADLAHAHGALLLVDGGQAAGAIPVEVRELGADLYAVAGERWLLGPDGTGGLWVSPVAAERLRPAFTGLGSFASFDPSVAAGELWPDARRFEAGGYHRPSVVGLARSCGWLSMYVGLPWAHERARHLAGRAADLLRDVPGVAVLTPPGTPAGLVTFRIAGWEARAAAEELGRRTFALLRPVPGLDALRIAVAFFNTEAELERLRDGVAELAGHTPETLPPRRRLTILGPGEQ